MPEDTENEPFRIIYVSPEDYSRALRMPMGFRPQWTPTPGWYRIEPGKKEGDVTGLFGPYRTEDAAHSGGIPTL